MELKRFFSLQEANQMLAEVRGLFERILPISMRMQERQPQIAALAANNALNTGGAVGTAHVEDLLIVHNLLEELNGLGVVVKDFQRGLVDFPYDRNGEEVHLCWEYGEDAIRFWHEVDAGYAGRRPIEEL
ncbi:MAG: DUF2203 domain-containing protein [Acidobacteriota bacterium]